MTKHRLAVLSEMITDFNTYADDATARIKQFQVDLELHQVGIKTSIEVNGNVISFDRNAEGWQVMFGAKPALSCTRIERIEAAAALPKLLDEMESDVADMLARAKTLLDNPEVAS